MKSNLEGSQPQDRLLEQLRQESLSGFTPDGMSFSLSFESGSWYLERNGLKRSVLKINIIHEGQRKDFLDLLVQHHSASSIEVLRADMLKTVGKVVELFQESKPLINSHYGVIKGSYTGQVLRDFKANRIVAHSFAHSKEVELTDPGLEQATKVRHLVDTIFAREVQAAAFPKPPSSDLSAKSVTKQKKETVDKKEVVSIAKKRLTLPSFLRWNYSFALPWQGVIDCLRQMQRGSSWTPSFPGRFLFNLFARGRREGEQEASNKQEGRAGQHNARPTSFEQPAITDRYRDQESSSQETHSTANEKQLQENLEKAHSFQEPQLERSDFLHATDSSPREGGAVKAEKGSLLAQSESAGAPLLDAKEPPIEDGKGEFQQSVRQEPSHQPLHSFSQEQGQQDWSGLNLSQSSVDATLPAEPTTAPDSKSPSSGLERGFSSSEARQELNSELSSNDTMENLQPSPEIEAQQEAARSREKALSFLSDSPSEPLPAEEDQQQVQERSNLSQSSSNLSLSAASIIDSKILSAPAEQPLSSPQVMEGSNSSSIDNKGSLEVEPSLEQGALQEISSSSMPLLLQPAALNLAESASSLGKATSFAQGPIKEDSLDLQEPAHLDSLDPQVAKVVTETFIHPQPNSSRGVVWLKRGDLPFLSRVFQSLPDGARSGPKDPSQQLRSTLSESSGGTLLGSTAKEVEGGFKNGIKEQTDSTQEQQKRALEQEALKRWQDRFEARAIPRLSEPNFSSTAREPLQRLRPIAHSTRPLQSALQLTNRVGMERLLRGTFRIRF